MRRKHTLASLTPPTPPPTLTLTPPLLSPSLSPPTPTITTLTPNDRFSRYPLLTGAALLYYAIARSASLGFSELFDELEQYEPSPERRFYLCSRSKTG